MQFEEEILKKLNSKVKQEKDIAFEKLYNKYYRLVFFIVSKYLDNNEDKEDLVQTIFLKILQSIHSVKDYNLISSYISTVAKNESINFLKRRKKLVSLDELPNTPTSDYNIIYIPQFVNCLKKEDINIIVLKIYYGYTFKEISELLNIPLKTVATHYYRALDELKDKMEKKDGRENL